MKQPTLKTRTAFAAAFAVVFVFSFQSATAGVGGSYKGTATNQVLDGVPGPNATVRLRLPNRKGSVGGLVRFGGGAGAIIGKVKKSAERQGGKKHIKRGNWRWFIGPPTANLTGSFSIKIKKTSKGYKIAPPEKVRLKDPVIGVYTSTLRAKK